MEEDSRTSSPQSTRDQRISPRLQRSQQSSVAKEHHGSGEHHGSLSPQQTSQSVVRESSGTLLSGSGDAISEGGEEEEAPMVGNEVFDTSSQIQGIQGNTFTSDGID